MNCKHLQFPAANTYTTIAMNLKHRDDVRGASNAMLLGRGEQEYLGELQVGEAIVKLQGRWCWPFLVKFPLVKVSKGSITDDMLIKKMERFFQSQKELQDVFSSIKAGDASGGLKEAIPCSAEAKKTNLVGFKPSEGLINYHLTTSPGSKASGNPEKEGKEKDRAAREALLSDIVRLPFSSTQDRYIRLGWSFYKGNRVRDRMVQDGWGKVRCIKRPDGMVKVFELTEQGKDRARKIGLVVSGTWRHGGLEHGYWVKEMAGALRGQGFAVQVERKLGMGKSVDLEARRDDKKIAIEVETGKSDVISNIRKDIEAGYDRIVVVCLEEGLKTKIICQINKLNQDGKDRITVVNLKEVFRDTACKRL